MRTFAWLASAVAFVTSTGWAQTWPAKPVRIITVEAGGGSDFATRVIAPAVSASVGQPVVVDNRGLLAAELASKAPPDGYTFLLIGSTLWLLPFMRDKVPYEIAQFTPVSMATRTANILVVPPSLPVKSVADVIALARAKPGELNYGVSGMGSSVHIASELFKSMTGVNIVRVNYKASARALTDLIAGQIQIMFAVPGSGLPHVKSGRLAAVAVTSAQPWPLAPGLPTVAATVPGYESVSWLAVFAPAGTPPQIVNRMSAEIARALQRQDVKEKFMASSMETVGSSPDELAAVVKSESARLGRMIRDAGIRAD